MTEQKYYDALTQQEVTEDFIKAQYEELTSKGDYFHDTYENFKNNNFKKLEYEFYERLFEEQQELFLSAFIQKQRIFPPDAPVNDAEPTERDIKVAFMAEAIERKTRAAMIESNEG